MGWQADTGARGTREGFIRNINRQGGSAGAALPLEAPMVIKEERQALAQINVFPYIMPSLHEMVEAKDKVSNGTILRTIKHNCENWRDAARMAAGPVEGYWAARAEAYEKVLELVESIERAL